jgi:hypothetical protein
VCKELIESRPAAAGENKLATESGHAALRQPAVDGESGRLSTEYALNEE